jgi:hypothetical protein
VIRNKQLASSFAAAVAMTALVGASAFAESRPSNETRARRSESRVEVRGDRVDRNRTSGGRIERDRSQDRSRREASTPRLESRSSRNTSRNSDRYRNNDRSRGNDRYRDSSRSRNNDRYRDNSRYGRNNRYDNRSRFYHSGRVYRAYPYGGGYRIWLTGCNYPFFIPSAYYHRDRFRIGLTIGLGGFYNSRGYYDYYDDYDRDSYYDVSSSRGEMRGVVESVDYRRETFVVRNDATGSFVTVVMRDRGRDPVRAGDYVELGGDWNRSGVFEAYRVDIVDTDRRR